MERTLVFDGCIARVHSPDLTEEERERRMKEIEIAACRLLRGKGNEKKAQLEE